MQSCTTVRDLLQLYLETIDRTGRYQKAGRPTTQRRYVERVCRSFAEHCGDVLVGRLNKGLLVTWRDRIEEDRGQTRTTINKKQAAVKRMLAWAAERDLVPENVWHAMNSVRPPRRGEVGDRPERGKPRRAVTWAEVVQVAEQCSPQLAAMLQLQALTSMRPGEVLADESLGGLQLSTRGLTALLLRDKPVADIVHNHRSAYSAKVGGRESVIDVIRARVSRQISVGRLSGQHGRAALQTQPRP